jgi:hypothetical protein
MGQQIKIVVTTDASGAVTGLKLAGDEGEKSAGKIKTAYEQLGIKTTADIEKTRWQINESYQHIKDSATSTADEIQRAERAKNAALDKLNQENTVSTQTMGDKLKQHWLSISAAAVAAYAIISKAADLAKMGATAMQTEASFKSVTEAYGVNGDAMLAKMQQISAGLIEQSDLQQRAMRGLQQGLSQDQITGLLEVARTQARVAGVAVTEAFDMIVNAVANQQMRALKSLGILVDQDEAMRKYAASIGIAKSALSEMQQSQALANAAIEQGKMQMLAMNTEYLSAKENMEKNQATMKELQETIGRGLVGAFQILGGVAYGTLAAIMLGLALLSNAAANFLLGLPFLGQAANYMKQLAIDLGGTGKEFKDKSADMFKQGFDTISGAAAANQKQLESTEKAAAERARAEYTRGINFRKMGDMQQDWVAKIQAMDPTLSEFDKQLLNIDTEIRKLKASEGDLQLFDTWGQQMQEMVQKSKDISFGDFMREGMDGIRKDLADLAKWYEDNYNKYVKTWDKEKMAFTENEKAKSVLIDIEAKKRFEIQAKYGKEDLDDQKKNLEKWKEYWSTAYDYAKQKIDELTQQSKALGDTIKGMTDFLAGLDAKKKQLTPQQQFDEDYKKSRSVLQQDLISPEQFEKARQQLETFLSKYSGGDFDKGGLFGKGFEIGNVRGDYEKLLAKVQDSKKDVEQQQSAWEAWGLVARTNLENVNDWMWFVQQKLEAVDAILKAEHTLKIDTTAAIKALDALGLSMDTLIGKMGQLGSQQRGGGYSSYTAGADTPGGGGSTYENWVNSNNFGGPNVAPVAPAAPAAAAMVANGGVNFEGGINIHAPISFNGDVSQADGRQFARDFEDELSSRIIDKRSPLVKAIHFTVGNQR